MKVAGSNIARHQLGWFKDQRENYALATDLFEASAEKRMAIFLTCLGGDAYDTYRSMTLLAEDKKDITVTKGAKSNVWNR